jgi:hypothetical protein
VRWWLHLVAAPRGCAAPPSPPARASHPALRIQRPGNPLFCRLYKRISACPLALQRLEPELSRLRTFATPPEAPAFWPLLALWPARKQGALLRLLDRGAISLPGGIKRFIVKVGCRLAWGARRRAEMAIRPSPARCVGPSWNSSLPTHAPAPPAALQVARPFKGGSVQVNLFEVEVPAAVWQETGAAAGQQPDLYLTEADARQLLCCSNSNQNVAAALDSADRVAAADGAASKAFLEGLVERLRANNIVPKFTARANLVRAGALLQLMLSGPLAGRVNSLVQLQKQHSGTALLDDARAAYQEEACLTARSAAAALDAFTTHMPPTGAARGLLWGLPGRAPLVGGEGGLRRCLHWLAVPCPAVPVCSRTWVVLVHR